MINSQPPPLLTNYFYGNCTCGFRYIFWCWLVIVVNSKAYCPNPGNKSSIPMIIEKKISHFLTSVWSIIRVALPYHLLQHHINMVRDGEVDEATLFNNINSTHHTIKCFIGKLILVEKNSASFKFIKFSS